MTLALVVALGGILIIGVVLGARAFEASRWHRSLVAYRLRLPAKLTIESVSQWLAMVAADTHAPQWSLLPLPPLGIEVVATREGIAHYVLIPKASEAKLLSSIRAGLPGVRLEESPDYFEDQSSFLVAGEARLTSRQRPLAIERAEMTSTALLASLQPLGRNEEVRLQVFMTSAGTPLPVHTASPNPDDRWWSTYLLEGEPSADAESVRAARIKQREPLLQVTLRLGIRAKTAERAYALFGRSWGSLHGMNAPGVRLVRRWLLSGLVASRMARYALPVTAWPLLANTHELAGLIAFPTSNLSLPGLPQGAARQIAPTVAIPFGGTVLADSNYSGLTRPLAMRTDDRTRHAYLLGPTGVGKSTLIANMALQDIADGAGVVVIDPKADLVADVLARIPKERRDDVIVIDPAAIERPVGFNLLGNLRTESERELAVDNVVHIMASIWKDSWGPRSNDIVRNALLTLTHTRAADGSAFTLVEVPELLTNPSFRRFVTDQPTVPDVVRPFWFAYQQMSDGERANVIAAPLNKLRALTTRSSLRLLLGQSDGIDLGEVFTKRILLVSLSKGAVGTETAQLLGSLLVASLWQATLKRAEVPREQRSYAFGFIDEFQDILRLPLDVTDMLAQSRSLRMSWTLANQYLGQVPEAVRQAVLGTVRSSVVFQLDYADADAMKRRYAPLTADDLMGLGNYEVAMRLSANGQTQPPVTGTTRPLPSPVGDVDELLRLGSTHYGMARADVEAALKARISPPDAAGARSGFGRKPRGDGA